MSAQPRHQCARCGRRQTSAASCGLCGGPVFAELVEALAHAFVEPAIAHAALRVWRDVGGRTREPSRLRLVPPPPAEEHAAELVAAPGDTLPPPPREAVPAAASAPRSGPRLVALDTVTPEDVVRRRVSWGAVDWMFGGGVPLERVVVVGGEPGIGKSTVVLGIASRLGGPVLFISTERQTQTEIARMVRQTGGDPSRVHVLEDAETIEDVARAAVDLGAVAIIVDSVQGIELEERRQLAERDRYLLEFGTDLATALEAVVFYISQRAKDGSNLGSQKLTQLCGTVLELEARADGAIELYAPKKNRGGAVRRRAAFRFDDDSGELVVLEVAR